MLSLAPPRQLALALGHRESFARDDFLEGPSNRDAVALIDNWPDWPGRAVVLSGPEGSGKSHLASVWAATAGARRVAGRGLAEPDLPRALATGALVLEDVAPETCDQRALFHLLNLVREERAWLLVTTRAQPLAEGFSLPDLRSRLRALPVVSLAPPDDGLLRAVLVKLFADRQIKADESLVSLLVCRIERSFAAAVAIVERLDREALGRKRPVSRALAAELIDAKP